jgi:hypothetical protein
MKQVKAPLYSYVNITKGPHVGLRGYIANIQWSSAKFRYDIAVSAEVVNDVQVGLIRFHPDIERDRMLSFRSKLFAKHNVFTTLDESEFFVDVDAYTVATDLRERQTPIYTGKVFELVPTLIQSWLDMQFSNKPFHVADISDSQYDRNKEFAQAWYDLKIPHKSSLGICGAATRGYGRLDGYGYFEYALPTADTMIG